MAELIHLTESGATVNGKPINLGDLVMNGLENIRVEAGPSTKQEAERRALDLADRRYGGALVLMGDWSRTERNTASRENWIKFSSGEYEDVYQVKFYKRP